MAMERKTLKFEIKEIDEEEGTFVGYAATFSKHPDSYGDIIDPGAFKKTLAEMGNRIKILWNHHPLEPIGKPTKLEEDEKGLLVEGKLSLGVQRAKEVLSLMKDGVITELSIGYNTMKETYQQGIRHLQEVKLYDVSPVTFAANAEAVIVGVKQDELKPFPNEHSCRLRDPADFEDDSFRRTTRTSEGKKYSVIMGRLTGEDTMTEQAYRYDKEVWEAGDAKTHCKEHDGTFEAAEKQGDAGLSKIRSAVSSIHSLLDEVSPDPDQEKAGRVLSASNVTKIRSALSALQALLDAAESDPEPEKSTQPGKDAEGAALLEAAVANLNAEMEGFDRKDAENRIEFFLAQIEKTGEVAR